MHEVLVRTFSDEFLRMNGVFSLDPETWLQPAEAAVLLGTTSALLDRVRMEGDPPSIRRAGTRGAVCYGLSDVLAARKLHHYASIAGVKKTRHSGSVSHLTFEQFLLAEATDAKWPFVSMGHVDRPVDLFFALTMPINKRKRLRWLTLVEYLVALRGAVDAEPRAELAEQRQKSAMPHGKSLPPKKKVRSRT